MSNDNNNYSIAGRYRTVRKNLDDLGYKQAISIDSLPLIELLLVDLAQTKESLKHFQSIAKDNLETCSQLQLAIDPYKCDNAKLVQECNQIHLELIETKEVHQKQSNEYKKRIRKLESELSDLQLSFSRNLQRIKQLETESSNKSKKILELQGKCCKPIVNNVNLSTKKRACYPLRRPTLECEPFPRTSSSSITTFSTKNIEPYIVDFVSMADHRISCLNNEVTKLKEELFLSNEFIETLRSQLNSKEKEMSRLRKMLEGGRPCSSINKDHCCLKSEKINGYQRNSENDELASLQQDKLNLEQQLKEALNKQHDAMAQAMKLAERNEELEKELKDVDRLALAVEADCNSTVKENNRRVCRLQEKLEDVMTQVHLLESELTMQRREAQELRADLEACRLEKCNVQRILESTLEEKKQMTDKINNLTIMETNLTDEIKRLCKENELQKTQICELGRNYLEKNERLKSNVDKCIQTNTNINKFEKKEEKAEANERKQITKKSVFASNSPDKSNEEKRKESSQNDKPKICLCHEESIKETPQRNMDKLLHEKNVIIESLQNTIERIESERDHYKCEYIKFKDQLKMDTEKDNKNMWSQICELRAQVSEKDHAISKLLREKKELCQEKFNLENKLHIHQSQQRSDSPCNFCRSCSPVLNEGKNIALNSKIERLERERDDVRADVERLIEERDALRERLKLATECQVSERRRLRESLVESESRLAQTQLQRRQLFIVQGSRRAAISGLDDQLEDLKDELRRTKQELTEQRAQYFQLRTLQDQTDQALGDVQGQLTTCENELSSALDRNKNLERQQLQLDNQIKELRQEIGTHRSRMAQLDREKDQLLMDLDEKTEKIAALEREIDFKEQQMNNMKQQIHELTHTKEICMEQAADLERQMRSMQLDIDNLQRQLSSVTMERENVIQDNRRLQDDLAELSCEIRDIHKELEASKAESHDLKRQLQTYVTEVRRAEELLSQKENERTEMLNHFRSLSLEATVLENNNHSLETEAAEAKSALQSTRDKIIDLERQLSDKDCLIRGYEAQITELSQNVARLEIKVQQSMEQRLCTEKDLRTVRNLCMTLEQQKEGISKQLNENTDLKSQYEMQLARFRSEQDVFQEQMNKDHIRIDRLERLLEEARKETIAAQTDCRELQCEISRLKQKISDLQNKLSTETCEVRKYQTQAAEYSKQISELRRQVTNERFERARIQEENLSDHQSQNENNCQIQENQPKACKCMFKKSSASKSTKDWKQSDRYNKVFTNFCASSSSISGNGTISTSNDLCITNTMSKKIKNCCAKCVTNCHQDKYQNIMQNNDLANNKNLMYKVQNVHRICFCMGNTKVENIVSETKNSNVECKKLNTENALCKKSIKNKELKNSNANSDGSVKYCGRCGGKKKSKQNTDDLSSDFIIETLNLVKNILEKKRKIRNNSTNDENNCKEVAIQFLKKDKATENLKTNNIKQCGDTIKANQSIKYSLIKECNSICTSSTQTIEGIITISEFSGNHLFKILEEIQQYTKSITECFQALTKSEKANGNDAQQINIPTSLALKEAEVPEIPLALPESSSNADTSLPKQTSESSMIYEEDSDISETSHILFTSTPQKSKPLIDSNPVFEQLNNPPLRLSDKLDGSTTFLSLPVLEANETELEFEDYDVTESTEYLELPKPMVANANVNERKIDNLKEQVKSKSLIDSNPVFEQLNNPPLRLSDKLDGSTTFLSLPVLEENETELEFEDYDVTESTEYLELPKPTVANANVNERKMDNLKEQVNEVYTDMESIQEKIERLRRDIYMDLEESNYTKEKNKEKKI